MSIVNRHSVVVGFFLLLIGCSPSLKMSGEQLALSSSSQGLIIGSLQVKLADIKYQKQPSVSVPLDHTTWHFDILDKNNSVVKKILDLSDYELKAVADEKNSFLSQNCPPENINSRRCIRAGFWPGADRFTPFSMSKPEKQPISADLRSSFQRNPQNISLFF